MFILGNFNDLKLKPFQIYIDVLFKIIPENETLGRLSDSKRGLLIIFSMMVRDLFRRNRLIS